MDVRRLEPGQLLTDEVFLVAQADLGVDRRGQRYYSLILNAKGGRQIEGKVWSDNIAGEITAGSGLEVLARVDEYRGQKQLNIQRYDVLSPEKYDLSAHIRSTDIDVDAAFEEMFDWARDEFRNPYLKGLLTQFHENQSFARAFKESPAASFHHHNYRGGLIEHSLEVWRLADSIEQLFPTRLDRELMLAGAALHDIGKINSYRIVTGISEHTEAGQLLDHIFISASMVSNIWDSAVRARAPEDDREDAARTKMLLLHIILSHHGKPEWGSPVLPRTPEAILIHYCDVLSATMQKCFSSLDNAPEGATWTQKVYMMDLPRQLWVPPKARPQPDVETED